MLCVACAANSYPLCHECEQSLSLASDRTLQLRGVQLSVIPVFAHRGAAARLVHNLKYRRSMAAARLLGSLMAERVPPGTDSLVPVPRVLARRIAYGIDQTGVLAEVVSSITGIPVRQALRAKPWARRSAGKNRSERPRTEFALILTPSHSPVLVDDVCTTGGTIAGAAIALGRSTASALVATSAGSMEQRTGGFQARGVA